MDLKVEKLIELEVTILILIDGFLQYRLERNYIRVKDSHNPYFNRWFSAIPNLQRDL